MASTYTLTVKFAPPGTKYYDEKKHKEETSTWGHVWLEARRPGERIDDKPSFSAGWSTGESKRIAGEDNLSNRDWFRYRGNNISSITVEITEEQFKKLPVYQDLAATGKISGFSSVYDAGNNSCIDFSGKGLGYIGLADKDFDGSGLFWARPDKQVNAFLEQIAKNRAQGADLTVEHRGRTYVFGDNERGVEKFWKTVDPYWYFSQNIEERQNQPQYAQAAPQPRLEDLPQRAQNIYHQGKEIFTEFCGYYKIPYRQEDLNNICMAMAAAGYKERMHGVSLIDIENGEISIAHESPNLREAVIRMDQAAQTPAEESISRIQQTERQFEQQELERQMAQSQSRSMSLS